MNDDNQFSLVGDEAMEARIIAWVLGEASPFEADELERICREQPKWAAFKRRIMQLHGLLADASKPVEEEWSLPAEKRAAVERVLHSHAPKHRPHSVAWWRMPSVQAAAASVGILGVAGALLLPSILEKTDDRSSEVDFAMKQSERAEVAPALSAPQTETARMPKRQRELPALRGMITEEGHLSAPATPAAPAAPSVAAREAQDIVTAGNRSGDGAIQRNSIDAVINNPNRSDLVFSDEEALTINPYVGDGEKLRENASIASGAGFGVQRDAARLERAALPSGALADAGSGQKTLPNVGSFLSKDQFAGDEGRISANVVPTPSDAAEVAAIDPFANAQDAGSGVSLKARPVLEGKKMEYPTEYQSPAEGLAAADAAPAPASAPAKAESIDANRRNLYHAEGNYNLGKYDEARKAYQDVLRVDPNNAVARRGMEQTDQAKRDYYKAAYDESRSTLLSEADQAWKGAVPPVGQPVQAKLIEGSDFKSAEGQVAKADLSRQEGYYNFHLGGEDATKTKRDALVDSNDERSSSLLSGKSANGKQVEAEEAKIPKIGEMPVVGKLFADGSNLTQLDKALHDQEKVVEKNRKLLDQIDRNKHSNHEGKEKEQPNDRDDDSLKRSLDQREFIDAKQTYEDSVKLLERMRLKYQQMKQQTEPVKPKPDVSKEISAEKEPFSTFSLHVSDASFRLAVAAMARGEWPAADRVRVEEFYNAFEYGDSAPSAHEPVACVVEQAAHPYYPQRNLIRIGVRTGSSGRGAGVPLHLTVLLDNSGSMERDDRRDSVRAALVQLSGLLGENDTITLVGFAREPRLVADRLNGAKAGEIVDAAMRMPAEGGTNLEQALTLGEELAKRQFAPGAQNRIVLLTDGAANLGNAKPEDLAKKIEELRQQGIAFDAAGIGAEGVNDKMLEALTRKGDGRYYIVRNPEDADAGFAKKLAGAFRPAAENVKVQVRWNPRRVASYLLNGFEEHRLNKEDFRNDAVDAAEMAAEEAGQALYQAAILPEGEGELGEVSVRFHDAVSGKMIERTWTIPYAPSSPAFDRATPSMQLAGLALMTAEKLRGGPLAAAIEMSSFTTTTANVRAHYANDKRIAELIEMIGKLK